jgi:hypothetical protein
MILEAAYLTQNSVLQGDPDPNRGDQALPSFGSSSQVPKVVESQNSINNHKKDPGRMRWLLIGSQLDKGPSADTSPHPAVFSALS